MCVLLLECVHVLRKQIWPLSFFFFLFFNVFSSIETIHGRAHCLVYLNIITWCWLCYYSIYYLLWLWAQISNLRLLLTDSLHAAFWFHKLIHIKCSIDFISFPPELFKIKKLLWKSAIVFTTYKTLGVSEKCDLVYSCAAWNKYVEEPKCISIKFHSYSCKSPSSSIHF